MPIKLDISSESVVVYCTDCGHWRAFAWTPAEGRERAAAHEERVHPESNVIRQNEIRRLARERGRHAADSIDVRFDPDDSTHGNSGQARPRTRERGDQLGVPAGDHVAV